MKNFIKVLSGTILLIALMLAVATPTLAASESELSDYGVDSQGNECVEEKDENGECKVFIDYGKNAEGAQCYSKKNENGVCAIVYSDNLTCIMDDNNYNPYATCILYSPIYKEIQAERDARTARIKLILSATGRRTH